MTVSLAPVLALQTQIRVSSLSEHSAFPDLMDEGLKSDMVPPASHTSILAIVGECRKEGGSFKQGNEGLVGTQHTGVQESGWSWFRSFNCLSANVDSPTLAGKERAEG